MKTAEPKKPTRGQGSGPLRRSGASSAPVLVGAPVILAGAILAMATWALTWWSAVARVTVGSGTILGTSTGGATSSLPLGQVPGRTVWVGLLVSILGLAALATGIAALRLKQPMARRRLGVAAMAIGAVVLVAGAFALLRGTSLVRHGVEANLARETGGRVSTVSEFEAKLGGEASVSFDAEPGFGVLAAMLGGIAIATGGWLLTMQPQPEADPRLRRLSS